MAPKMVSDRRRASTASAKAKAKAKTKAKAKAKTKAKAKAKTTPAPVPQWELVQVEAVYISKIHKMPASFLDITNRQVQCWDFVSWNLVERFTPVAEGTPQYPIMRLLIKKPMHQAADDDATAEVQTVLGNTGLVMPHELVVGLAEHWGYPIF